MVFAFVGVVCAVLLAYAQDDKDKKKPFDSPEAELSELASEHLDCKKECKEIKKKLDDQKKVNGTCCPILKKKHEVCKDFLKTIQKAMKDCCDKIEKEDKEDEEKDDDDSDSDDDD